MGPLLLRPNYISPVWSGSRVNEARGISGDVLYGESFDVSVHEGLVNAVEGGAYDGTPLDELLRRVYREAAPNRYLAGFAPFLHHHRKHPAVASMLHEEFTRFFRRNLRSKAGDCHTVHFVGSIACFFAEEVGRAAAAEGFATGRILRSPIDGLRLFHGKNRENS